MSEPTRPLDEQNALEIVSAMQREDASVSAVVAQALPAVAEAVEAIASRMRAGGRLIYAGAGTSGRLGALDAAECPPTFGVSPERVRALIAGGPRALLEAVEGAEDDAVAGKADVLALQPGAHDSVVGLAASGRTPYTLAAVQAGRACGAFTVAIACVAHAPLLQAAHVAIALPVGAEIVRGSTRLKAGTAQKLVLNMLSTAVMIRLGFVYDHSMVGVQIRNAKLRRRAVEMVAELVPAPVEQADALLEGAGGDVRVAVLAGRTGLAPAVCTRLLVLSAGSLRAALRLAQDQSLVL